MSDLPSFSEIGVVFDLDGVLIDSHDQHERSWFQLAAEIGKPLTKEQFKESFGMRNVMCIPHVFHWADPEEEATILALGERKEELYRELLAAAKVPAALGSSTSRKNIEVCFAATGLARYFGPNYTGAEDVSRGKPAPDVFLEAARKIARDPARCLVVEDAHVGIEAALAAGMRALAVTTTHPRESFLGSGATCIVDSLVGVDAKTVRELLS